MSVPRAFASLFVLLALCPALLAKPGDGNRLTYLDDPANPYYVSRTFPKLVTPQWVGEDGVEAVVVLAIDDMRDPKKYETYLRPILDRLKQIDGRAPVSIMTNGLPDVNDPLLQQWLKEGLSLETHTFDHPCPLLAGGDFAKAKGTYDKCVDLLAQVPGSTPVAFRMPCCDSLNTPSPRFYAEIFNRTTPGGRFLSIDTSVFNITTANDPDLPRELVLDPDGRERFRKYVPFESFVNTIEDYPYPYVIGRLCWQFPCATPSDWQAQNLHKPDNPRTVDDWKALLDATVIKQGTMNLVFHPHNWIKPQQVAELVDYAQSKHGKKVKFLTFRECFERLNMHLLAGHPLRDEKGNDNGVRVLDLNNDGYMDVAVGNGKVRQTRTWEKEERRWIASSFPIDVADARFGILRADGAAAVATIRSGSGKSWNYVKAGWVEVAEHAPPSKWTNLLFPTDLNAKPNWDFRFRDFDGDGRSEVLFGTTTGVYYGVFAWNQNSTTWVKRPFAFPAEAGLRFIDVDEDGHDDVIFSNGQRYGLRLFNNLNEGWGRKVLSGKRGERPSEEEIPPIIRADGTDNGVWFHSRHLWVQNEDTAKLPNLVDRRSFAALLKDVPPAPKSPEAALASMKVRPGFKVELVAAEPMVMDPVNFDWGPDGKLWVAEMGDYPLGADGKGRPGGRVRYLEDKDGDGKYDKSTLFLDGLKYPDGVLAWRKGVLVCAAPDIFYAEDTDGDGRADKREVLFTGFTQGNPQHLVNGFARGLDNWLYGANGHSGGNVTSKKTGKSVRLGARDFRIRPDEGLLDPQGGVAQFGRPTDDWGNHFGVDNSVQIWHYVLEDHYTRRNPHVAPPNSRRDLVEAQAQLYPVSVTLERFNDFSHVNRVTSANGLTIYRDDLFGPHFENNWFVSEPVHNLVHRGVLEPDGVSFKSRRAAGEEKSEFLASTDNWFRPTTLKTGPDGALWVADMYRQVIEHPEWIPVDWQRRVDLRGGADKGRIYRVYPVDKKPRPIPRLDKLDAAGLVAALDSPSGWQRDVAQQLLVEKKDKSAVPLLEEMAARCARPQARLHALCTLDGIRALKPQVVQQALDDKHPGVRRHAVRLCEGRLKDAPQLADALKRRVDDPDATVRLQLAYTLGEWAEDPAASGAALAKILVTSNDPYIDAAVLSSVTKSNLTPMFAVVLDAGHATPNRVPEATFPLLFKGGQGLGGAEVMAALMKAAATPRDGGYQPWQFKGVAEFIDDLDDGETDFFEGLSEEEKKMFGPAVEPVRKVVEAARAVATDENAPVEARRNAVRLLGCERARRDEDVKRLTGLLKSQVPDEVQAAAVKALAKVRGGGATDPGQILLAGWKGYSPSLRREVLDVLLERAESAKAMLAAVEAGKVLPAEIEAERRQRLLQHTDRTIRQRAAKLLAEVVNPDRQKVMEAYAASVSMQGDPSKGRATFEKICATCHKLGGVGNPVGPDLAALTDKSGEFMLLSIVDPNRAVEARYTNYVVETAGGQTLTGILSAETGNSVTLVGANGKANVILRKDLKSLRSNGVSLMPEGLEAGLSPGDMADLIAFVRSATPEQPRKTFAGNNPQVVHSGPDGSLRLTAKNAEVYGSTLVYEPGHEILGYWQSADDRAVWVVEPDRPGRYDVWLEWACHDTTANNRFWLATGEQRFLTSVPSTKTWENYQRKKIGQVTLRFGKQRISIVPEGKVAGALMDLKSVELRVVSK